MAPDQDEIDQQVDQLVVFRRRLAHDLRQQATLGNMAPFSLAEQIRDSREHIRSIKQTLREWNVAVEESPSDEPSGVSQQAAQPSAPALPEPQATVDKRA